MSPPGKDALPPSYSETISNPPHSNSPSQSTSRGPFLSQLSQTRTSHINSIISTHILPLIETRASFGIAQTTIALLPSDVPLPAAQEKSEFSFDIPDTKAVEVIGFSSEDEPRVVRLEGQVNRTEFWRVQAVIAELEVALRERLNASDVLRSPTGPTRVGMMEQRQPRKGLMSRIMPGLGPEERLPSGNPEVGMKQMESCVGMVLVKARLEELCLRTVTEFGLYDTMSKQCVIIRLDARC